METILDTEKEMDELRKKHQKRAAYLERKRFKLSKSKREKIEKAITSAKASIMKIPGVIGIGYGPRASGKAVYQDIVIEIYAKPELYDEIRRAKKIPASIGECPVKLAKLDLHLTYCRHMNSDEYGTLSPGVNVGPDACCGSLGMFVWPKAYTYYAGELTYRNFLTSWHVATDGGRFPEGTSIYQPGGSAPKHSPIGFVSTAKHPSNYKYYFEAAIVQLSYTPGGERLESQGLLAPAFPYEPDPTRLTRVMMIGPGEKWVDGFLTWCSDGHLWRYISQVDPVIDDYGNTISLVSQLLIAPFQSSDVISAPGDSGSVWFDEHNVPVALTVGSGYLDNTCIAIASPLSRVLEWLNWTNVPTLVPSSRPPAPPPSCVLQYALNDSESISFLVSSVYPLLSKSPLGSIYHKFKRYDRELYEVVSSDKKTLSELKYLSEELVVKYIRLIREKKNDEKRRIKLPPELMKRVDNFMTKCAERMSPRAGTLLRRLNVEIQSFSNMSLSEIEAYLTKSK